MTAERIKEIQSKTAFSDSVSVCQALLQVWNECSTSSQTEISDEEIEMAALHHEPRITRRAFKSGATWYREQLKQRQNG